ncbi:MAG: hypothetical protein RLZZ490_1471 [Cyanobacteriota bacterium]
MTGINPTYKTKPKEFTQQVEHPAHYNQGKIECIDAIEAALSPEEFRGFLRGNAIKYLWRAGLKDDRQIDLEKARWYLDKLKKWLTKSPSQD